MSVLVLLSCQGLCSGAESCRRGKVMPGKCKVVGCEITGCRVFQPPFTSDPCAGPHGILSILLFPHVNSLLKKVSRLCISCIIKVKVSFLLRTVSHLAGSEISCFISWHSTV